VSSHRTNLTSFGFGIGRPKTTADEGENWFVAYALQGLEHNPRIQILDFARPDGCPTRVEASISAEIDRVLRIRNTTLAELRGLQCEVQEQQDEITRLLALNRHGHDFLRNALGVPLQVWGDVLMRISNEDCNYFVAALARQTVVGRGASTSAYVGQW
jgi:hypothetical protein